MNSVVTAQMPMLLLSAAVALLFSCDGDAGSDEIDRSDTQMPHADQGVDGDHEEPSVDGQLAEVTYNLDGGTDTRTYSNPEEIAARLRRTLEDLAAFGEKRAGTPEGRQAGEYLLQRFDDAGLEGVTFESSSFLSWELTSSQLALTIDGTAAPMAHEAFAYSGSGQVEAELVNVGTGHDGAYDDVDVSGKIVLVTRDPLFHRSTQYRLVIENGGVAMLYISQSPENLIQVGTVADPEDGMGPIPTVTVGADDGETLVAALNDGSVVTARIEVDASITPAVGRNVVGRLWGDPPRGEYLLLGAHYDTWYAGSTDNGTGVAALLEVAEAMAQVDDRRYGLVFVAYDGEELGLFGGYDYLRDHLIVGDEPVLAFINFEMPATEPNGLCTLAHTNGGPLQPVLRAAGVDDLYPIMVGMEVVPTLFGGIIPTDIQGMYWSGVQGVTTACDAAYYHTPEDTVEKIDVAFLSRVAMAFEQTLLLLEEQAPEAFFVHDPKVWRIEATTDGLEDDLQVDVLVTDSSGTPQETANVRVWLDVDDFTRAAAEQVETGADGRAHVIIGSEILSQGTGGRWLHVIAGKDHTRAESITPLP